MRWGVVEGERACETSTGDDEEEERDKAKEAKDK